MLFRPSFCANCGEKIERTEWRLWTSRRFCIVCEGEFKGHELLVRSVGIVAVGIGVVGFGAYLTVSNVKPTTLAEPSPRSLVSRTDTNKSIETANKQIALSATDAQRPAQTNTVPQPDAVPTLADRDGKERPMDKSPVQENQASYFCGAETKKGTPCTRRVKGNVRCYQHIGMPAMLPAAKLKIS